MYSAFVTAALTAAVSTVVGSAVSAVIASLIARKKSKKAIDEVTTARYIAIENGLQSILRAEIIRQHDKHTERGYCPLYAKEAMVKVYDAYHALGGNGMMTRFYNEIIALPEEPQRRINYESKRRNHCENRCAGGIAAECTLECLWQEPASVQR